MGNQIPEYYRRKAKNLEACGWTSRHSIPNESPLLAEKNSEHGTFKHPRRAESTKEIFIGNVKLRPTPTDDIAEGFLQSTRKTLQFIPPIKQKGEIVIRPSIDIVEKGSKRWQSTAVGYFLGRKPYFPQLESFARTTWRDLQQVSATSNGFYFFQFKNRAAMEDVIEGGPWLFQGQLIVLQVWEQGMSLRRQKHTKIPVWIRLKHLPMEYWTTEGLSAVASGVGPPLYSDKITKTCSRLDFARVCVILDYNSTLPKHLVVISPITREVPVVKHAELEADTVTEGEGSKAPPCNENQSSPLGPVFYNQQILEEAGQRQLMLPIEPNTRGSMIKVASWNVRGLNGIDHQRAVEQLSWSWFDDYSGPAGRI
ncbi:UNVERIFIED_CONTAM: hypothetical protein Scaly_3087100, partial [Sesamum calycinum]